MGRKREANFDDPPRFHKKGTTWYHVGTVLPRKWAKLSSDRAEALRMWAQIEGRKVVGDNYLGRSTTTILAG